MNPAAYTTCHAAAVRRRMVTFTRIPYAEAARRARLQDLIVYASLLFVALIAALGIIRLFIR